MKKILSFFVLAFFYLSFCASIQAQPLQGIGIFKVGQFTKQEFEGWLSTQKIKLEQISNISDYYKAAGDLKSRSAILYPNPTDRYGSPIKATYLPGYQIIYLNRYNAANIDMKNLYLLFLNDTLVQLEMDFSLEMENALTVKYGVPVKDVKTKEIECVYTYTGAKNTKQEINVTLKWRDDDIQAYGYRANYYDSDCKSQILTYFICYDNLKAGKYTSDNWNAEKEHWKAVEQKSNEDLKKKLDDF